MNNGFQRPNHWMIGFAGAVSIPYVMLSWIISPLSSLIKTMGSELLFICWPQKLIRHVAIWHDWRRWWFQSIDILHSLVLNSSQINVLTQSPLFLPVTSVTSIDVLFPLVGWVIEGLGCCAGWLMIDGIQVTGPNLLFPKGHSQCYNPIDTWLHPYTYTYVYYIYILYPNLYLYDRW